MWGTPRVPTGKVCHDEWQVYNAFRQQSGIDRGAAHPSDIGSWCLGVRPSWPFCADDPYAWTIDVDYGQLWGGANDTCPWHQVAKISGSPIAKEMVCDRWYDGTPIRNSAMLPYNPPLQETYYIHKFVVKQAEEDDSSYTTILPLLNKTNEDSWAGGNERSWKICNCTKESNYDQTWGNYFDIEYELQYNSLPWGWDRKVLDQGYYEKKDDGNGGTVLAPITKNGVPVSQPHLLDGSGHALADCSDPSSAVWNTYQAPTCDFSSLFNQWRLPQITSA
jgi:hypothetical protein